MGLHRHIRGSGLCYVSVCMESLLILWQPSRAPPHPHHTPHAPCSSTVACSSSSAIYMAVLVSWQLHGPLRGVVGNGGTWSTAMV